VSAPAENATVATVGAPATPGPASRRSFLNRAGRFMAARREVLSVYAIGIALLLFDATLQPGILTLSNLNLQTATTLTLIIVAAGQAIVMLSGGIDLSVGGIVTLSTCFAATKLEGNMAFWIVLILVIGAGAGALNGLLVAYRGMQPFVVTLATWSIFNGLALIVLPQEGGVIPEKYMTTLTGTVGEIGVPVLIVILLAIVWLWFRSSRWGSRIAAVGSSPRSAYLSGIPVRRTLLLAYVLSGFLAALAGLFLITQTASGSPLFGSEYVLNSVAAAVIGGVSLAGGRGSFIGAIAGAYILTLIASVVFGLGLESYWQPLLTGVLLVVAVCANTLINRSRGG
jgi:ribose transport system permease protein